MFRLSLMFCFSCVAFAESYPLLDQLPEDIWQLQADGDRNIRDAIYVKSAKRVTYDKIYHYQLVRIFSERGKAGLQTLVLGQGLDKLVGRVISPNGEETHFDDTHDLMKVLIRKAGDTEITTSVLMPPGLTPNCVLEVSWSEKAKYGLPLGRMHMYYPVPEIFYCREKVFELSTKSLARFTREPISSSYVELATRVIWSPIEAPAGLEEQVLGGYTTIRYTNVAALENQPFGLVAEDTRMALVQIFRTLQFKDMATRTFWHNFSSQWLLFTYGNSFHSDGAYGRWLREVQQTLPDKGVKGVRHALNEFKQRFTRTDLMTHAQRGKVAGELVPANQSVEMMNLLAARGYGFSHNLGLAFFRVLRDLGFQPLLLFAANNPYVPFHPKDFSPFLLDLYHPAIGLLDREGNWHTFAPAHGEYDIGHLPDFFRESHVLAVDPADEWSSKFIRFKRLDWKKNRLLQSYTLALDATGKLSFSVAEQNEGVFNAYLRGNYHFMDPEEQAELMVGDWQEALPAWQIGRASVEGVADYQKKIVRRIQGVRKLEMAGHRWLAIQPFPGSTPPLPFPEQWPEHRTQPIVLPDNLGQISRTKLKLPAGWEVVGDPSWERSNELGMVRFRVTNKGDHYLVERRIIIANSLQPAEHDPLLRAFISWTEDSMEQTVAVRPLGAQGGAR